MSIQINGIDKPKNCFDCPCIDNEFAECAAKEHYLLPKDEYGAVLGDVPDWCPITELQTCEDAVSRQAAINALWKALHEYEDKTEKQFIESDELDVTDWIHHRIFVQNMSDIDRQTILNLPSAQPERKTDEWCSDCKEYDQEGHCCPRFNRVIRQMLSEQRKTGKWIGYNTEQDGWKRTDGSPVFMSCSECNGLVLNNGSAHWNYCPNCGAKMEGAGSEDIPMEYFESGGM